MKNTEYELFNKLSNEWWDEEGKFKVLHQIKPIRLDYIIKQFKKNDLINLNVLDVGCGGGLISEPLSRLGCKVTAIDFIEKNVEIAKERALLKKLKINYICGNVENIDFKNKFDLIIMFEILEHLEDWKKFLLKINKNLKLNGKIIISTINRNILAKYLAIYLAENLLNLIPKGTHSFEKFIKPNEIKNYAEKHSFAFENLKGLVFNPLNLSWKISNNININYFCTLKKIN